MVINMEPSATGYGTPQVTVVGTYLFMPKAKSACNKRRKSSFGSGPNPNLHVVETLNFVHV